MVWIILFLVAIVICCVCVAKEESVPATITVIIAASIYGFFNRPSMDTVKENITVLAMSFGGYLAVGSFWACLKWKFFCIEAKRLYFAGRDKWLKSNDYETISGHEAEWDEFIAYKGQIIGVGDRHSDFISKTPPQIRYNLDAWITWAVFWPFSFINFLLTDLVVSIFKGLFNIFSGLLQKISNDTWKDVV